MIKEEEKVKEEEKITSNPLPSLPPPPIPTPNTTTATNTTNTTNPSNSNPITTTIATTLRLKEELKRLYKEQLLPLEKLSNYEGFYSPPLSDSEFDSKPHVLVIGQYSTGKTTVIFNSFFILSLFLFDFFSI